MARGSWRICSKHKIAHQPRDKCSRLRVLNHSRPMAIPPINAGGRPAWLLGPGGRQLSAPAIRISPAPAGSHPNKTCSKKTNIQAANSPPGCANSMWPSGGATLGYIALTATAMSSNAHVRQTIEQSTACLSSHPWSLQAHEKEQDRYRHAWSIRLLSQTPFNTRLGTA